MKSMNAKLVSIIQGTMKGARLAKFNASVAILNESLAQGGWKSRGSVKANSGFYQGLLGYVRFNQDYKSKNKKAQEGASSLMFCLSWGKSFDGDLAKAIPALRAGIEHDWRTGKPKEYKASDEVIQAWVELCAEKDTAYELLDAARPLPRITAIGLSPKVTKTLQECNLDLDLPSIQMAKIEARKRPAFTWTKKKVEMPDRWGRMRMKEVNDKLVPWFDKDGKRVMETYYVVVWSKGIVHGQSRFAGGGCHACGKHIPSGRFVPIEAKDKKSGNLISMWIGCDCSANIFGIKDIGIEQNPKTD